MNRNQVSFQPPCMTAAASALLVIVLSIDALAVGVPLGSSWTPNAGSSAAGENTVQLSGNTAAGYTYFGEGTTGNQPGTTNPDSRTRPKVYNDFSSVDLSATGSTLSMSYDILWNGSERPSNESQDWRFGFIGTQANGGLGVSLGANFDIGNLAGTTYYEFYVDPEVNPAGFGEMDFAFSGTNNSQNVPDVFTDQARIGQSQSDPFNTGDVDGDYNGDQTVDAADYTLWRDNDGTSTELDNDPTPGVVDGTDYTVWANNYGGVNTEDIVAFNDTTDTHRVTLNLTRIANGYDLDMSWTNLSRLVNGVNPTLTNNTTITTAGGLPNDPLNASVDAAMTTEWDRLGFFINANDNRSPTPDEPWGYVISNVSVETTGVVASSAAGVPEPASWSVVMSAVLLLGPTRRRS